MLDDLLRDSLTATTDARRAELGAQIAQVPNVIEELGDRLRSASWDTRRLALHFLTRLAPPPAELTRAFVFTLHQPLSRDPFGEETILGLVIAGVIASRVTAYRWAIEARVQWIERAIGLEGEANGDRPAIALRLARDTLAKLDAAIAIEREQYDARIAIIADRFATAPGDAIAMMELQASTLDGREHRDRWAADRHGWMAAAWRSVALKFPASSPQRRAALEHSLEALRWWASGASSGGEGMANMVEVHALEAEIAALPTTDER